MAFQTTPEEINFLKKLKAQGTNKQEALQRLNSLRGSVLSQSPQELTPQKLKYKQQLQQFQAPTGPELGPREQSTFGKIKEFGKTIAESPPVQRITQATGIPQAFEKREQIQEIRRDPSFLQTQERGKEEGIEVSPTQRQLQEFGETGQISPLKSQEVQEQIKEQSTVRKFLPVLNPVTNIFNELQARRITEGDFWERVSASENEEVDQMLKAKAEFKESDEFKAGARFEAFTSAGAALAKKTGIPELFSVILDDPIRTAGEMAKNAISLTNDVQKDTLALIASASGDITKEEARNAIDTGQDIILKEAMTDTMQFLSNIEESSPEELKSTARGLFNLLEMSEILPTAAVVKLAKAAVTKTAEAIKQGVKDVAPIVKKGVKEVGAKIEKARKFDVVSKEGVETLIERPSKDVTRATDSTFRAIKPRIVKKQNLKTAKAQMAKANEIISDLAEQGKVIRPKDVKTYAESISQSKKEVWDKIEGRLKSAGDNTLVRFDEIASEVKNLADDVALKRANPQAVKQIQGFADDLVKQGKVSSVIEAEQVKQMLNAELGGLFGEVNLSRPLKEAKKKATLLIGKQLDELLAKTPGDFANLKRQYGALRSIEDDVVKRMIVFERQNPESLFEGLGKLSGFGDIAAGITTGSLSRVGEGITKIGTGALLKRRNDANVLVENAFKRLQKGSKEKIKSSLSTPDTKPKLLPFSGEVTPPLVKGQGVIKLPTTEGARLTIIKKPEFSGLKIQENTKLKKEDSTLKELDGSKTKKLKKKQSTESSKTTPLKPKKKTPQTIPPSKLKVKSQEKLKRKEDVPKELESLAEEAKRFDSAEEFINAYSRKPENALTREEYIRRNGGDLFPDDVALHVKRANMTPKQWDSIIKESQKTDNKTRERNKRLGEEYDKKLKKGEIRKPTEEEELKEIFVQGHPDNEQVKASVEVAKILGYKFKTKSQLTDIYNKAHKKPKLKKKEK